MRRVNGRSLTQFVTQKSKYTYLYLLGCGSLKKKMEMKHFIKAKDLKYGSEKNVTEENKS